MLSLGVKILDMYYSKDMILYITQNQFGIKMVVEFWKFVPKFKPWQKLQYRSHQNDYGNLRQNKKH